MKEQQRKHMDDIYYTIPKHKYQQVKELNQQITLAENAYNAHLVKITHLQDLIAAEESKILNCMRISNYCKEKLNKLLSFKGK